ncbi:TetR/AcrR family transcriptional regulator [Steroidobacter sp.]|uniref:TetR/AcrR family transcriptional regulator n=1 Tax=Steroidobacter sp. TaxID=1978227 RepID=UPI001A44F972|nr:TetR/AcrR family transcriptional regulator [Steroidobacter sp.]MBL8270255.1 TetR/AcrR family transcriptional regulator [Steroidobacter sp.]
MKQTKKTRAPAAKKTPRTYQSKAMVERRARIIAATLAIVEESGIAAATTRNVSERAGVALRTLYLQFENREAMIGTAIKEFFYESIAEEGAGAGPRTIEEILSRIDRLTRIIKRKREYSKELAPVYFSSSLDSGIYGILRDIAISHVTPFLDDLVAADSNKLAKPELNFLHTLIANAEYSIIDDAMNGRLPEQKLGTLLKLGVLSSIAGFIPNPPAELLETIRQLRALVG